MEKKKLTTFDIVLTAMFSAILIVSKELLAWLPNIEIVTMLIILYTRHFPRHTLYIIYIFAGAECCLYGITVYSVVYFYVWTLLYLAVLALRKTDNFWIFFFVATMYGFLFGTLCSPIYFFIGGWKMVASWIAYSPSSKSMDKGVGRGEISLAGSFCKKSSHFVTLSHSASFIMVKEYHAA